jgi:quercetin dioxygenase-like cupin family protein
MSRETSSVLIPRGSGESVEAPGGIEVIFKVTKEMSGGAFSLVTNIAPPRAAVPMHTHHKDHETVIVQRGRIVCRVGEETFSTEPGDTIHMPAGVPHGWRTDGEDEVELLVIFSMTSDTNYERFFREISQVPLEDWEAHKRAQAANAMEMPMPLVFV